jgi:Ca-activated chloride channel family protein
VRNALVLVVAMLLSLPAYRIARAQVNPAPSPAPKASVPATKQPPGEEVDPEDVLRVNTTLVTSPALIIGRDRRFVPNLRREDFHVFDEGVEQKLAYFAPVDKPFTVALVIDTSHSMLFDLQDLQDAARAFVDKMRPGDRALIVSFDNQVRVLAEPTTDRDALRRAISNLRQGGPTRLYDAIDFVLNQRMDHIADRRALILFSDGVDSASQTATPESNLRDVLRSDVLIYPIEFSTYAQINENHGRERRAPPAGSGFSLMDYLRADAYLHQLAEETGVALYPAADIGDLGRAVSSIVEELHNEYSLGYYPTTAGQPGEVRRIEVRVGQPQLQVRARTSYVVGQSGSLAQATPRASVTVAEPSLSGGLPIKRSSVLDRSPTDSRWMCKGPGVPSDFAILQDGFDANCSASNRPNDATNAWFIRKPGPNETVCKGFLMLNGREMEADAIPTGYAVVGEAVSPGCARSNDSRARGNAWRIKLPGPQETVCKGFIIPRGYVIRGETVAADCPLKSARKNAWLINPKTVRRP